MSQYISSFLVEPVIRQARRFSRPGFGPEPLPEPRPEQEQRQQPAVEEFPEYVDTVDTSSVEGDGDGGLSQLEARHRLPVHDQDGQVTTSGTRSQQLGLTRPDLLDGLEGIPNGTQDAHRIRAETDPQHVASTSTRRTSVLANQFRSTNASFPNSINEAGMRYMEESSRSRHNTDQSSIAEGSATSPPPPAGTTTLPEDDGMGEMRERIIRIQDMKISGSEKSRLMHALMIEQYSTSQLSLGSPNSLRPRSPSSLRSHDRPFTPTSTHSTNGLLHVASPPTSISSGADELYVTAEDLKPTYYTPRTPLSTPDASVEGARDSTDELMNDEDNERELGCAHYKRNVKLQCSACSKWYTCRFCHDEVEDHSLKRRETKNMLCMLCGCAQPAAEDCRSCGKTAAWYYCGICKLWDNDPEKSIYHCNDCGICRIGQGLGKDFYHCKTCNVCLAVSIRDTHRCIERSTDCDCPICGEYMFTSPQTVVFMRCGHSIHYACYKEHARNSYKCPICSRSITNMEMTFRHLDKAIESQPMPPQFRDTKAWVYCNDCCAKTLVKYHWLGLKCAVCDSYNTAQLQILSQPDHTATETATENAGALTVSNDVDMLLPEALQSVLRGRTASQRGPRLRTATSTSILDSMRQSALPLPPRRDARSISVSAMDRIAFPDSNSDSDSDGADTGSDGEEEEDDVDFWGGESPRDRALQARSRRGEGRIEEEDEDEEDDDEDDVMVDELDDDDDDDDEDLEEDHMDIIGHR